MKERIKELMRLHALNAKQLAEKTGVQPSSVSHLLTGRNKPSVEFLEKLLKAFPDTDIRWLITGESRTLKPQAVHNEVIGKEEKTGAEQLPETEVLPAADEKAVCGEEIILLREDGTYDRFRKADKD